MSPSRSNNSRSAGSRPSTKCVHPKFLLTSAANNVGRLKHMRDDAFASLGDTGMLAAGQPVFVDFTAAWCVTCQYNKKTTLANADVLADLSAKKVALLRADWTRRDPAITAALAQLGRNGVPVYVFYKQGRAPVVLSEILRVEEVRSVIDKL